MPSRSNYNRVVEREKRTVTTLRLCYRQWLLRIELRLVKLGTEHDLNSCVVIVLFKLVT